MFCVHVCIDFYCIILLTFKRMDPHQLIRLYGQKCKFHIISETTTTNGDGQL